MNTIAMASYRPFQKLHPLSLLAQLTSRQANGCLQVASGSTSWSIYLEQGKLLYATNSTNPFERLDRHLRRLSLQVPGLVSSVRVQVRLLFESALENQSPQLADYQAICWLVEQQHLTPEQAASLIEELAKEVLETFLTIQEGTQEVLPPDQVPAIPQFCQLDLRPLVEYCQTQIRQRQPSSFLNDRASNSQPPVNPNGLYLSPEAPRKPTATPVAAPASPAVTNSAPIVPLEKPASPSGKSTYTIACIDDSPTVLNAIRSFLDDKSFTVLMIDNPVKALMQIIRSKPDLVLLDVTMPNLDGYELCSLLRRHPQFRNTPIVMVTGNTGFIDRAKAKLVGASGYLTKPFTQPDLVKMVFKHLN